MSKETVEEIKVESGIPVPKILRRGKWKKLLERMRPGQSVLVDAKQMLSLRGTASRARVRMTQRAQPGGKIRAWRV